MHSKSCEHWTCPSLSLLPWSSSRDTGRTQLNLFADLVEQYSRCTVARQLSSNCACSAILGMECLSFMIQLSLTIPPLYYPMNYSIFPRNNYFTTTRLFCINLYWIYVLLPIAGHFTYFRSQSLLFQSCFYCFYLWYWSQLSSHSIIVINHWSYFTEAEIVAKMSHLVIRY